MTATIIRAFDAHDAMTVAQALGDAQEAGLTECLIVGYDADGRLVLRSSGMARRDALWLIEQAKRHALDG
jgi:hypothetical protein